MLRRLTILLLLLLPLFGSLEVAAESLYVVTANSLNVRSGPGTQYSVQRKLHRGDTVVVLSKKGQWATVQIANKQYYVNAKYLRYAGEAPAKKAGNRSVAETFWDKCYYFTKIILWILAAIALIAYFVNESVAGIALLLQLICGIGALIGWLFFDNGKAGAVITMGIELILFLFTVSGSVRDKLSFSFPQAASFSHFVWATLAFPFFVLNMLQFWLSKPWRPLMKENILPDKVKPAVRTILRVLQFPFYIAVTPLRLLNAVYYNMLIYNLYAWSNYIVEVFVPSDFTEGSFDAADWIKYLPKRIGKYLLWHGSLTIIESVVWTVIDTIVPAVTLYHGTAVAFADNMLCDPNRSPVRQHTKGWKTGVWNVGTGNYAGDGIYFGIFRRTLNNYEKGAAIATRVTMGKTIDMVLLPDYVYNTAGQKGAKAVSNWGLNNGYVSGEWWRRDGAWWEICLFDRQNRYNESWRIRPIYAIYADSGIMQRIPGGPAHWLFRKQVVCDIWDTLMD